MRGAHAIMRALATMRVQVFARLPHDSLAPDGCSSEEIGAGGVHLPSPPLLYCYVSAPLIATSVLLMRAAQAVGSQSKQLEGRGATRRHSCTASRSGASCCRSTSSRAQGGGERLRLTHMHWLLLGGAGAEQGGGLQLGCSPAEQRLNRTSIGPAPPRMRRDSYPVSCLALLFILPCLPLAPSLPVPLPALAQAARQRNFSSLLRAFLSTRTSACTAVAP